MRFVLRLAVAMCVVSSFASAQTPASAAPATAIASHPDWPKARPADVDSVDHIMAAIYDVISGPAHQARDWERFKSLFVPGGRLIPVRATGTSSDVTELSIEDYVARASKTMEASGFFEHSTHNVVEQFGDIVHVFSTYESRHTLADEKPFARGINSFQLLKDGNRYWIVTIYWEAERPDLQIPSKYLPAVK
jgi:flavin-binding protein dodecin